MTYLQKALRYMDHEKMTNHALSHPESKEYATIQALESPFPGVRTGGRGGSAVWAIKNGPDFAGCSVCAGLQLQVCADGNGSSNGEGRRHSRLVGDAGGCCLWTCCSWRGNSPVFTTGHEISKTSELQNVEMMSKTVELIIFQFHSHSFFPKLFSDLLAPMDLIFGSPISEIAKRKDEKALHTDKMVAAEEVSAMDKVCIEVFKYLSSTLDAAATCPEVDFNQIQLESVSVVFSYVEHYLPHSVRANAGKIIGSLSVSPKHAEMICQLFWEKLGSLKKEKDFRNFSTWIDGVMGVQLSLETLELVRTSVNFLSSFLTKSKKVERGVLRMKFLARLAAMLERICKSKNLLECSEVVDKIEEIYQIVMKSTERKKHLVFCLECLGNLMIVTYPAFFVKHAA